MLFQSSCENIEIHMRIRLYSTHTFKLLATSFSPFCKHLTSFSRSIVHYSQFGKCLDRTPAPYNSHKCCMVIRVSRIDFLAWVVVRLYSKVNSISPGDEPRKFYD